MMWDSMNTINLLAAGSGVSLTVGGGLLYYGDCFMGSILLVLGMANVSRFIPLWRKNER